MSPRGRVWMYRVRSLLWIPITATVFLLDLQSAVWILLFYSAYANAGADWAASEAADDRALRAQIKELEAKVDQLPGAPG